MRFLFLVIICFVNTSICSLFSFNHDTNSFLGTKGVPKCLGGVKSLFYEKNGKVKIITKKDGVKIFYSYFNNGNIEVKSNDNSCHYRYVFNKSKQESRVEDLCNNSSVITTFDPVNRLFVETFPSGFSIKRQYDVLGRLICLTLPDNSLICYEYERAFLKEIQRYSSNGTLLYCHQYLKYDAEGHAILQRLAGNIGELSFNIDEKGRCIGVKNPYFSYSIEAFDENGLITSDNHTLLGKRIFKYDEQKRLISDGQNFYSYDSEGNLLQKNSDLYAFDEQQNTSDALFQYDANGRCIAKKEGAANTFYRYDALDRLVAVEKDTELCNFTYDGWNRKISSVYYKKDRDSWIEQKHLFYLYVDNYEIGSCDITGTMQDFRVLGLGTKNEIGGSVVVEIENELFVPLHDLQGNISALIAANGEIAALYKYSPFGAENILQGKELANPWRFSSKRVETIDNLVFFGARFYDPVHGRWLTGDPLGTVDGPNCYAFCGNCPVNKIDSLGFASSDSLDFSFWDTMSFMWHLMGSGCYYLGETLDFVGSYFCSFDPFLQDTTLYLSEILKWDFQSPCVIEWDKVGNYHPKIAFLFVNGVRNGIPEITESRDLISEKLDDRVPLYIEYVPFRGWVLDIFEGVLWQMGYDSKNVLELRKEIRKILAGLDKDGKLHMIAHSRGVMLAIAALNGLSSSEIAMITLDAFASPKIAQDDIASEVRNVISFKDYYPFIMDPVGIGRYLFWGGSHLKFIVSPEALPYPEHFFSNPEYQKYLQERIDLYYKEAGLDSH